MSLSIQSLNFFWACFIVIWTPHRTADANTSDLINLEQIPGNLRDKKKKKALFWHYCSMSSSSSSVWCYSPVWTLASCTILLQSCWFPQLKYGPNTPHSHSLNIIPFPFARSYFIGYKVTQRLIVGLHNSGCFQEEGLLVPRSTPQEDQGIPFCLDHHLWPIWHRRP